MRAWASRLKHNAITLWFACRHPLGSWHARAVAAIAVGYAFSPIDLIPDFIPVLGYLDDVILLPLLIAFALRLLPEAVLTESRERAQTWIASRAALPKSGIAAAVIVLIWATGTAALGAWLAL